VSVQEQERPQAAHEFMTAEEVADLLRCSRRSVIERARQWGLRRHKIGRRWVYNERDVRDYLKRVRERP
jgi:excisionase family DNA binding protein